jgi:hypothetical protein
MHKNQEVLGPASLGERLSTGYSAKLTDEQRPKLIWSAILARA